MRVLLTLLVLAIGPTGPAAAVPKMDVAITSPDGVVLRGTYFSPGKSGPAIVLFHQCNMDRHAWDGLAPDLTAAGIHVLAFDSRGYGESGRGRPMPDNIAGDGDAAYRWLIAQKDVDKARTAAGGASCGVARSVSLAMRHRDIKALVLLSGLVPKTAADYIAANPALAVFAAAATRDIDGAGVADAARASKNPASTLKMFDGSAHGVVLFDRNADLKPTMVKWLQAVVQH
jgi:dienelactone hydrolase